MPELRVEGAVFQPRLSYRDYEYIISGLEGRQGPASQMWRIFFEVKGWTGRAVPHISHNSLTAFGTAGYDERQ